MIELAVAFAAGQIVIAFSATAGASYEVQSSTDLATRGTAAGGSIQGNGSPAMFSEAISGAQVKFYRVVGN